MSAVVDEAGSSLSTARSAAPEVIDARDVHDDRHEAVDLPDSGSVDDGEHVAAEHVDTEYVDDGEYDREYDGEYDGGYVHDGGYVDEADDVDGAGPRDHLDGDTPYAALGGEATQVTGGRWSAEQALDGILAEPTVAVAAPAREDARVVQDVPLSTRAELRVDFGAHLEADYRRLVAQLYAITLDPAEAHAVVQDAYSRAWRSWGQISRSADPTGWVRRVAVRSTIRSWRRWRKRPRRSVGGPGPETRTGALLAALRQLSAAERRCVVLHHMAGSSIQEIAAVEAAAIGTIAARLARAQQIVTDALADAQSVGFDAAARPDPWSAPVWDEPPPAQFDPSGATEDDDEEHPR